MGVKQLIARVWARHRTRKIFRVAARAVAQQKTELQNLLKRAEDTDFGKAHGFKNIRNHADFQRQVPVRDYEQAREFFEKIAGGASNVTWPGKPLYLAKTSGTTSGAKYIPITKESIPFHIQGARDVFLLYLNETGNTDVINGKLMFLSGSPELDKGPEGIKIGRLSGIVNHWVPAYLQGNRVPTYKTNCIDDWEEKVTKIVEEVASQDLRVIGGIPPWVQMFFEKLEEEKGQTPLQTWPNLKLFIQGGVDFSPYQAIFDRLLEKKVDILEIFPASEGFFAYQDSLKSEGMLLHLDSGIFFEFIPVESYGKPEPIRLTLEQVEIGVQYALVVSTNAGLWAYDIGDTVRFVSLDPYRIKVSGRIKHFISAFGEHVIAEEVNQAMIFACTETGAEISEFTVAPFIAPKKEESYHEWLVEFVKEPADLKHFLELLDQKMGMQNAYYADLRVGNMLKQPELRKLQLNASREYMRSIGKLGGQNKFPRLSNDRKIAGFLSDFVI